MKFTSFPEIAASIFQTDYSEKKDRGRILKSIYIPMRDGVRIAIDLTLPRDLQPGEKLPVILQQTRYHRRNVFRRGFGWVRKFVVRDFEVPEHGYANVYVDVRGTGSSYGSHPSFIDSEMIHDMADILDWIVEQPWSNGKVMTIGVSYGGLTAEIAACSKRPALSGIIPIQTMWDLYSLNPGGIRNVGVSRKWQDITVNLDQNDMRSLGFTAWLLLKGSAPVDDDIEGMQMQEAILEHKDNERYHEFIQQVYFRDDPYGPTGLNYDDFSMFTILKDGSNGIPLYIWGSWYDSITANTVIDHFLNWDTPMIGVIGSWAHTTKHDGSPYNSGNTKSNPTQQTMIREFYRFFDFCGKEESFPPNQILYYTIGSEVWRSTSVWPPEGHHLKKWFLGENNGLTEQAPQIKTGYDHYNVDYTASSGSKSRWFTLISQPVEYKNRDKADEKLLIYTTPPFSNDFEMTGHPIARIFLSSTHQDGCVIAYVEDIDEKGRVHYLTEGGLRLVNRKLLENPQYKTIGPQHSLLRSDATPMVPDEVAEIAFTLLPISVVIKKGHRLRIAIAGADKDNFSRYPETGEPTLKIMRNTTYPSSIEFPIIR